MESKDIQLKGYQMIDRISKRAGNSASVQVPVGWIGKHVTVILLDPIEEESVTSASTNPLQPV